MRKSNMLKTGQSYQLCRWLEENWDAINEHHWTREVVSAKATEAVGFSVTCDNLSSHARAIGRSWPNCSGGNSNSTANGNNRKRMYDICRELIRVIKAMQTAFGDEVWNGDPPNIDKLQRIVGQKVTDGMVRCDRSDS